MRRAERLGSRNRPRTVAVPAAPRLRPRPFPSGRKNGRLLELEPETGVNTLEQTRRTFGAAVKLAAMLQDGKRGRALAHGPRPQPAPVTAPQPHTQQPGIHPAPVGPQEKSREHPGGTSQPRRSPRPRSRSQAAATASGSWPGELAADRMADPDARVARIGHTARHRSRARTCDRSRVPGKPNRSWASSPCGRLAQPRARTGLSWCTAARAVPDRPAGRSSTSFVVRAAVRRPARAARCRR